MEQTKIFIDREAQTGNFLMRMPVAALPDFYEMLVASPLLSRRWFYQVKEHLENYYRKEIERQDQKAEQMRKENMQ